MNSEALKNISLFLLAFVLFSCTSPKDVIPAKEYYRSTGDSLRSLRIERNLIPMYSITGKVKRRSIQEMMTKDRIPGMSMVFIDDGEIAWMKHYGLANVEDSIPVDAGTVFTGASLSKPITAYAALRLVEEGKLHLDRDVNTQLKEWKIPENDFTRSSKVTLRKLIAHRAGIKNDLWTSYTLGDSIPSIDQMLSGEEPSVDPPVSVVFVPGTRTKYSNPGYAVIQKLLMDVEGEEFDDIIDKLVFKAVGMSKSSFKQPIPKPLMEDRAVGYSNELEPYPYRIFPYEAAGGIWTTANDLSRFLITVLNDYHQWSNILVSQKMSRLIFNKEEERFVFSMWNWGDDIVFRHTGSNQGFNCLLYGSIEKKQGLIVMTNSDNAFGLFEFIQRAINLEYNWEYVVPEVLEPRCKNIDWVDKYLGNYQWNAYDVALAKEDDILLLLLDKKRYPLTQVGVQEFISNELSIKLTFSEDKSDYFYGLTLWGPGGGPSKLDKLNYLKQ